MNKIYCTIIDWEMKYRLCLLWYKGQEISDFECSLNVKAVTTPKYLLFTWNY